MRTLADALSPSLTTKFILDGWEIRVLLLNKGIEITDLPLSEKMNRAKSGTSPPILVLAAFILVSFPPFFTYECFHMGTFFYRRISSWMAYTFSSVKFVLILYL